MKTYYPGLIMAFLAMAALCGAVHAQTQEDCIECPECDIFETWKSMCRFTYQICIVQGLPDEFCLEQKEQCEENIDDLTAECRNICRDSCEETSDCPDGICTAGENCAADAGACSDNICYEPTCLEGCGEIAVPDGVSDESCNAIAGCQNPPCSCDGNGTCTGSGETGCHEHENPADITDGNYKIKIIDLGCRQSGCGEGDGNSIEALVEILEGPHCGEQYWVWVDLEMTSIQPDIGSCYDAFIMQYGPNCGWTVRYLEKRIMPCPVCENTPATCEIEISFDKEQYCEDDLITMTVQLYENNILTDYDEITAIVHLPSGDTADVTERMERASAGTYTIDGYVGGAGERILEVRSAFGSCNEAEEGAYVVSPSNSAECGGGESCSVNILFDKEFYCPDDEITIITEFYENEAPSEPNSFEVILHKQDGDMDITSFFESVSRGVYSASNTVGSPGERTVDAGATFADCDASDSESFMVFAADSSECTGGGGPECTTDDECDDNDACTTDTCDASGDCASAPIAQCTDNDGCCPAGCTQSDDDDCGTDDTCSIEVSYDKAIYCEDDAISITAEYKSNNNAKDPQVRRTILGVAGTTRDVTDDFVRIREGTYVTNNHVGSAGTRTLTLTSTMDDGCSAETESQYNVLSEENCVECENPSQCGDQDMCTEDVCANGICRHDEITSCTSGDGCCPEGCNPTSDDDCVPECSGASQCDDNNLCTIDSCVSQMCEHQRKTICDDDDGCCPAGCTKGNDNDCSDMYDVLIVGLKNNMDDVYSSTELANIEDEIRTDYINALQNDGLSARFFYLDEDDTSDVVGIKVAKTQTHNPTSIDAVLEELIKKLNAKYVIILGGQSRFPMGVISGFRTDDLYADYSPKDNRVDVPVGRILDPNNGDYAQLMSSLDALASAHESGGLDLSKYVSRSLGSNYLTMECFSLYVWGQKCPAEPNCKIGTSDSQTAASGSDFFYLTQHGSPGPPQVYSNALSPNSLNNMDVTGAVWMIVPCHGGVIDYSTASQGITQMFIKRGGPVFFGSTYYNCCAVTGTTCTTAIDSGGVGALYYRYARNFAAGKRIGDAYLDGKKEYLSEIGYLDRVYINNLYGDPTIKIKKMW